MNYTYCERLMWVAIAPAAFRYLARQELGWDISALKQLSKQIYRQMVSRTPDIGSMMENPLRVCLTGGILWLSIYKAAEEKMSEKRFEGMVSASMRSPLVVAAFRGKAIFLRQRPARGIPGQGSGEPRGLLWVQSAVLAQKLFQQITAVAAPAPPGHDLQPQDGRAVHDGCADGLVFLI